MQYTTLHFVDSQLKGLVQFSPITYIVFGAIFPHNIYSLWCNSRSFAPRDRRVNPSFAPSPLKNESKGVPYREEAHAKNHDSQIEGSGQSWTYPESKY